MNTPGGTGSSGGGGASVSVGASTAGKTEYPPTVINIQASDGKGFPENPMGDVTQRMKQMGEDMRRMQLQMQEQFKNFPIPPPPMPEGFMPPPPMPLPMDINQTMGRPLTPTMAPPLTPNMGRPLTPTFDSMGRPMTPTFSPDLAHAHPSPHPHSYDGASGTLTNSKGGKKQLKLQFDMHQFKPDEIQVKADKNKLEVHAQHEEKEPNRVACRVFHQQYSLPKDVKLTQMQYKMTPEGTLAVEGAVKPQYRVKFASHDQVEPYK